MSKPDFVLRRSINHDITPHAKDISLKVDNLLIPCNKQTLMKESLYFQAMFSHTFQEKELDAVEINGVEADTMKSIVDFMHGGSLLLTSDNIDDIIHASAFLQMNKLSDTVCRILTISYIDIENSIAYFSLAQNYGLPELAQTCKKHILRNFTELASHPDLLRLDISDFISIISEDKLYIRNEDIVFESALRWVEAGHRDMTKIMPFIRLPYCTQKYQKEHNSTVPFQARDSFQKLIVIKTNNFHGITNIWFTDLFQSPWQELTRFPHSIIYYSACNTSNGIIITGGYEVRNHLNVLNTCYLFDTQLKQWKKLPPMPRPRSHHTSIFHNNAVYVIAGRNHAYHTLYEVDKFENGEWTEVNPLRINLRTACVASLNQNIFVFSPRAKTQVYNSLTDQWSVRKYSPCWDVLQGFTVTATINNVIYLLGGSCIYHSAWLYNPLNDQWRCLQSPKHQHPCASAIVFGDKILLGGGTRTDIIEQYDINDNVWSEWKLVIPEYPDSYMTRNESHMFCTSVA